MIKVEQLTKMFGTERAVDRISFEVARGEILGLLGPNGAGKSTTMRVLTCYLPPTEGRVTVNGLDVTRDSLAIRKMMGYLPESTPLYSDMIVEDYLRFVADLRGMTANEHKKRSAFVLDVCGLTSVSRKQIDTLSKGYRQRVGLAQAMIHDPEILVLDEPTSGLDPNQIVEIRDLIRSLGTEKTVILSTHILPEVQASCNRVLIINEGKIVADGTPDGLQASLGGGQKVRFGVLGNGDRVAETIKDSAIAYVLGQERLHGSTNFMLGADASEDIRPRLFSLAVENGWQLTELHRETATLEDVFRKLTVESGPTNFGVANA